MSARIWLTALLALALGGAAVAQEIELVDGSEVTFEVGAITGNDTIINTQFFVDVPADARNLSLELTNLGADRDLDVLVRTSEFSTLGDVYEQADYWSISLFGDELVNVQEFSNPSVGGKRWFIALVAFAGAASDARLRVDISNDPPPTGSFVLEFAEMDSADPECLDGAWDDPTPVTAGNGNSATTLGQARRNAMIEAANRLGEELTSRVPIRIRACWKAFEADEEEEGVTLASAGPETVVHSSNGVPQLDVIYPVAVAERLAGVRDCQLFGGGDCDGAAISIDFNDNYDKEDDGFYYGISPAQPNDGADFIQVAMHEITHGLGFITILREDGTIPAIFTDGVPRPDAYALQLGTEVDDVPVGLTDSSLSDAERAAALTSVSNLIWLGEEANISPLNDRGFFGADQRRGRINAPDPYEPGSSVSHLANAHCALMNPAIRFCNGAAVRTLGLAKPMLNTIGWQEASNDPPYLGLMFDRERTGHGFEFALAGVNGAGDNVYVKTFYTYDNNGNPEWYQAIGTIVDGAFQAQRNGDGNGMPRYFYDVADSPPQTAQTDPFAQAVLSFNAPESKAACNDGEVRTSTLATQQWEIDTDRESWCVEELIAKDNIPAVDFGGLWFDNDDAGWGFTLENFVDGDGSIGLFVLLYVYAADGSPIWFFALQDDFVAGQPFTMDLFQRTGFGRTATNSGVNDAVAGTMTLTLTQPADAGVEAGNTVSIDVTYQGSEGGSWLRQNSAIVRLSQPR